MTRQSILAVPWVVMEDLAPQIADGEPVDVCAQTVAPTPAHVEATSSGSRRAFVVCLVLTVVWLFIGAGLILVDIVMDADGVLIYIAGMGGLFCGAFIGLTYPRDESEPETWWTLGSEAAAYGQCTPSRAQQLTGRDRS